MSKYSFIVSLFLFVVLFSLVLPKNAYAYLDLGTGSYLFQVVLAVFFVFIYSIRSFIKSFFQKLKNTLKKLISIK